jgi:hypothetical protein
MATGKWIGPLSEAAPPEIARTFGQKMAEEPIQDDMRGRPELGSPGISGLWIDNGSDNSLFNFMAQHGAIRQDEVALMRDYRNHTGKYSNSDHGWSRPDVVVDTAVAKEYYEIKPMSFSGFNLGG